jgi:O-antigen ligase
VVDVARRLLGTDELRVGRLAFQRADAFYAGVPFVLITTVCFADGGLLPRTWRLAIIAMLALAVAALVTRPQVSLGRLEWAALTTYASLTGWTALSAAWSPRPQASLLQGERVLVYVAALLAFLLIMDRAARAATCVGVLAGVTVVVGYGLFRYLLAPPPLDVFEGDLLFQPLGYANAVAIVASIGIVLALGFAIRLPASQRRFAMAPVVVLAPALYYTESRGGIVALVVGLGALAAFRSGASGALVLAVVALLLTSVFAIATATSHGQSLAGDRRPQYWHVALEQYRDRPVLGSGAGTYGVYWLLHRPSVTYTRTAHSVYLQSLAELGPVGLLLLVAALAIPLAPLRRPRDTMVALAAGAYVAYLVHTGVDWDWELPGATLPAVICGATLLVGARGQSVRPLSRRARAALCAVALAFAIVEVVRLAVGPGLPYGG